MTSPNSVKVGFREFGKLAGFQAKGSTLYSKRDGLSVALNLQKSQNADRYFLNIGCWIHALAARPVPPQQEWNVRLRPGDLGVGIEDTLDSLLDLDSPVTDAGRVEGLVDTLAVNVLPVLDGIKDLEDLRGAVLEGTFPDTHVNLKARAALGL